MIRLDCELTSRWDRDESEKLMRQLADTIEEDRRVFYAASSE